MLLPIGRTHRSGLAASNLLAAALVASSGSAFGATVNWVTDGNGQWTNAANWSSAPALPGVTDDVVINRASGDWLVTLGAGPQSIKSLIAEERLRIVGTLLVQDTATINNTLTLAGGTLTGGVWTFAPGRFVATGSGGRMHSTTINGDIAFDAAFSTMEFGDGLAFNGTARLNAAGAYIGVTGNRTISSGTTLFNAPTAGDRGAVEALASGSTLTLGPGAVVRGGHGDIGGTLAIETALDHFTNNGVVSADRSGASIRVLSDFTNNGTAEAVAGGTLELGSSGSFENHGTVRAASGGTVRFVRNQGHSWNQAGTTQIDGGTVACIGNFTTSELGTITSTSGRFRVESGIFTNTGATLNLPGVDVELDNGRIVGGTINAQSFKPGQLENNFLDGVTLNGDMELGDTFRDVTILNGLTLNGTARIGEGSDIRFTGTQTVAAGTFRRVASAELGGDGDIVARSGVTTFGPATVIEHGAGLNFPLRIWSENQDAQLVTQGLVRATGTGSTVSIWPRFYVNQGTIESLNGATVSIGSSSTGINASSWRNEGVIRVTDANLRLFGNFTLEPGSSIEQSGNSTVTLGGTIDNTGRTITFEAASGSWTAFSGRIRGGAVNFTQGEGIRFSSLSFSEYSDIGFDDATINGDLAVDNSGRINFANTINLNGVIDLPTVKNGIETYGDTTINGGTIRFGSASVPAPGANRFTVHGTSLTLGPGTTVEGGAVSIAGPSGNFTQSIVNHGTIHANLAAHPLVVAAINFANHGTVKSTNGSTAFITGVGQWANHGTLLADGGRLVLRGRFTFEPGSSYASQNDGTVNIEGWLDNTGRVLAIDSAARTLRLSPNPSTRIQGGTINLSNGGELVLATGNGTGQGAVLDRVTLNGNIRPEGTHNPTFMDSFTLNGTLRTFNSNLVHLAASAPGGTFPLSGNGTIVLEWIGSNGPGSRPEVHIAPATTTLIEPGFTIRGGGDGFINGSGTKFGRVYAPSQASAIVNRGTIRSELPDCFLSVVANSIDNQGLMEAVNGAYLVIGVGGSTAWENNGVIRADGATVVLGGATPDGAESGTALGASSFVNNGTLEAVNGGYFWYRPDGLAARGGGPDSGTAPIGSLTNTGTLSLRRTSDLAVGQSFVQTPTGSLVLGLSGDAPGVYSTLTVTGDTVLAGTLDVVLDGGFQPEWTDTFTLIQSETLSGAFSDVNLPSLVNPDLRWWYETTATSVLAGVRHFADFNHDGGVNTIDLTLMLGQFGSSGPGLLADIDGNGAVTTADLTQFLGSFGLTAGALTSVPSPGIVGLIAAVGAWASRRRRPAP